MPDSSPQEAPTQGGLQIPLWLALAALLMALLVAGFIALTLFEPLVSLVLPSSPEVPIPPGSVEQDYFPDSRTSDGEWLYSNPQDACQVAEYYITDADSTCNFTPYACVRDEAGELMVADAFARTSIARCSGTHEGIVDSYAWEVFITNGGRQTDTQFRVYLYSER